jgi:hypothetical protein|tara:strand:+ start:447 stop:617 length:171 start_codon:yes stop_codon:yes gene_type:complete
MIDTYYVTHLRLVETKLQIAIWEHEKSNAPVVIINEMKDASKHLSKAIDILEWDEE